MGQGQQSNGLSPDIATAISPDAPNQADARLRHWVEPAKTPQGARAVVAEVADNLGVNLGEPSGVAQTLHQFRDVYESYGLRPEQALQYLFSAERMLRVNPVQAISQLCESLRRRP